MTKDEVERLLRRYFEVQGRYEINDDLTVSVKGSIIFVAESLRSFPVNFRDVSGSFRCNNGSLTSLLGSPRSVGIHFFCHSNQITSLQGGPETVGGSFDCAHNQLTTLEGAPKTVGEYFYCHKNPSLTSLVGAPKSVGTTFWFSYNRELGFLTLPTISCAGAGCRADDFDRPNLDRIVNLYAGRGRASILAMATELIAAGYPNNAKF